MKVECCICFDEFGGNNNSPINATKCGHLFHKNCITEWLKQSQKCPQCNQAANTHELRSIFLNAVTGRRSEILDSTIVHEFRDFQEDLLAEQENLKEENKKLLQSFDKSQKEIHRLQAEVLRLQNLIADADDSRKKIMEKFYAIKAVKIEKE